MYYKTTSENALAIISDIQVDKYSPGVSGELEFVKVNEFSDAPGEVVINDLNFKMVCNYAKLYGSVKVVLDPTRPTAYGKPKEDHNHCKWVKKGDFKTSPKFLAYSYVGYPELMFTRATLQEYIDYYGYKVVGDEYGAIICDHALSDRKTFSPRLNPHGAEMYYIIANWKDVE